MSVSKSMSGSPWHTEKVHRAENDDRRYKGRCEHYRYDSDYCIKRCGRCMGSAHCDEYTAISEAAFKARKSAFRKKTSGSGKKNDIFAKSKDEEYWF